MTPLRRQLQSMLSVEPREGGFTATFTVRPDLAIFPDHFRDNPILPGVCMIQAVLLAAAQAQNLPDLTLRLLKNAKMMRPIRPNDQIRIEGTVVPTDENAFTIKATFTTDTGHRCAEFSMMATALFPPLPPGEGRGEGELRETPQLPSPGTPGEGREGVPSTALTLTRASSPCRTTPPVEPFPLPTIPNPESGSP